MGKGVTATVAKTYLRRSFLFIFLAKGWDIYPKKSQQLDCKLFQYFLICIALILSCATIFDLLCNLIK